MSTEDNSQQYDPRPCDDERPAAVRHADAGAQAWRAAVHAQQVATPDHADFYSLAGTLVDTFAAVESLTRVLAAQIERYPDRLPIGRRVYDDTRTTDPRVRLNEALAALHDVARHARDGSEWANRFWSAIGHIGVEDAQPWPEVTW
jgi:hypothetical protein